MNMGSWTEEDELAMAVSRVVLYFNCLSVSSVSRPTNLSSFTKTTPYTYSRTKGNDNGGGSGWSDDGKACTMIFFAEYSRTGQCMGKPSIRSS
jgi:hypothetical protein